MELIIRCKDKWVAFNTAYQSFFSALIRLLLFLSSLIFPKLIHRLIVTKQLEDVIKKKLESLLSPYSPFPSF